MDCDLLNAQKKRNSSEGYSYVNNVM